MSGLVDKKLGSAFGKGLGVAVGALALMVTASNADAAVYTISASQLNHQNCSVFTGCYRGSMSFDYDTTSKAFSNVSWNLGYNTSSGSVMESVVTTGQDTKVMSSTGVPHTTARVMALTGTFFTPDWLFYSNTAPSVTTPGSSYLFEYSGAGLLADALGLDIDIDAVIAGTSSALTVVYMVPNGGSSNAYGGIVSASLASGPIDPPTAVPLPGAAFFALTGFGALAAMRRRKR